MVFFKSVLKAFQFAVGIGFVLLFLSLAGITIFADSINTPLGYLSFLFLLIALVLWKDF